MTSGNIEEKDFKMPDYDPPKESVYENEAIQKLGQEMASYYRQIVNKFESIGKFQPSPNTSNQPKQVSPKEVNPDFQIESQQPQNYAYSPVQYIRGHQKYTQDILYTLRSDPYSKVNGTDSLVTRVQIIDTAPDQENKTIKTEEDLIIYKDGTFKYLQRRLALVQNPDNEQLDPQSGFSEPIWRTVDQQFAEMTKFQDGFKLRTTSNLHYPLGLLDRVILAIKHFTKY